MPDYNALDSLPADFREAARPEVPVIQPPKITVSLPVDADVLAYFQNDTEPSDWQGHINGVLRFYMETNMAREADFHAMMEAAREPEPSP